MWENNSKKGLILNIFIGLLLVAISFGLYKAISKLNRQMEAEDKKLSEARTQQVQEQSAAREENLEAIQIAYRKDMETVEAYLPGIVCWGDSLTAGSSGNVSYPYTLQKFINTYLCSVYDFRSTIPNSSLYPTVNWSDYTFSVPVINMGGGKDNVETILGRAGVRPYIVSQEVIIPAEPEQVPIFISSPDGKAVTPLTTGSIGINPVTIAGVEGTLILDSSSYTSKYFFQRSEAGQETKVARGTEVNTACADQYKDYIHIVWMGAYSNNSNPQSLVADTKLLLERQLKNPDRYLVISPCSLNNLWSGQTLDAVDSAMMQAFGNHYVSLRKYLIEDGISDYGISVSPMDQVSIAQGSIPSGFRTGNNSADLNGKAYEILGKLLYERMDRLGYFDEVRSELSIDSTQEPVK